MVSMTWTNDTIEANATEFGNIYAMGIGSDSPRHFSHLSRATCV